ncbi:succinate dehydrogenase hydrophobic membrane anchor subunit [Thermus filiformis]|uniref:Succinate dehydrogenase n=1 Tax=Thermus filiformis TaxID=276 RepID=A0A0A2WWU2_THEFI|nr:succinate dehydrogenase hydrophobic membrane anchor subunit [Thermus filiformis]KGQ22740.1 succinate dehydrogenase [Thermus filiformis]
MAIKSRRFEEARLEASSNLELFWWVFMRVSGVVLVFLLLGHMWMNAILTDLNTIDYDYVAKRLSQTTWKLYDWLILALGLLHGANGLRYVLDDWVRDPAKRFWTKVVAYGLIGFLFVYGSLSLFNHDFGVR